MKPLNSAFKAAVLACLLACAAAPAAWANNISTKTKNMWSLEFPNGSTNTAIALDEHGRLNMQDGIVSDVDIFDPVAFTTNSVFNVRIPTGTLVRSATTFVPSDITDPPEPMALDIRIWTPNSSSTSTFIATMTIKGIDAQGQAVTELIKITTTSIVTNNAFVTISSVTISTANAAFGDGVQAGFFVVAGATSTFGLSGDIHTTSDVYGATAFGVETTSFTAVPVYNTVRLSNPNDGMATRVRFRFRKVSSSPVRPK